MRATLRYCLFERRPLDGHVGESGAQLERARLDDGTPVVVKTLDPAADLTMQLTGGIARDPRLFQAGVFDRLPEGVGHAVLDAWSSRDGWTLVMRDVQDGLITLEERVTPEMCQRVIDAVASLHLAFADEPVADLCPLQRRLELFAPAVMGAAPTGSTLPAWVLEGWAAFWELCDPDVADAVRRIHDDHGPLAKRLGRAGSTMLHGDAWLSNVALMPDEVVLLDWALATAGPPAVEWAYFLGTNAWQIDLSHEEILDRVMAAENGRLEESDLQVGLLWGLANYGWNKAFHAANNPDPDVQSREAADLRWWVDAARAALEVWSPPV